MYNEKGLEITEQQEAFLDAYFGEAKGATKAAAEIAGVNPKTASKWLRKDLREHVLKRAEEELATKVGTALSVIDDAMDQDKSNIPGLNNRFSAAKEVLDRIGMIKKDKITVDVTKGGIILLPVKDGNA